MNFSCNVSFASLPLFLPTIISEFGSFDELTSNGLSAPPYLLCFFVMIGTTVLSDRVRMRGPFAALFSFIAAIGYLVLAVTTSVAARYTGLFLVVLIFTTTALILTWNANTNENESKRAGGLWLIMTVGQCGTLLGTHMFPDNQAPLYRQGMWIGFAFSLTACIASAVLSFLLWRENRRRDRVYGKVPKTREGIDVLGTHNSEEAYIRYIF